MRPGESERKPAPAEGRERNGKEKQEESGRSKKHQEEPKITGLFWSGLVSGKEAKAGSVGRFCKTLLKPDLLFCGYFFAVSHALCG